jgi:hypothetical protein
MKEKKRKEKKKKKEGKNRKIKEGNLKKRKGRVLWTFHPFTHLTH